MSRLILLPRLGFSFFSIPSEVLGRVSIDSLLFSPCELLIKRERLAILDRLRDIAAEDMDDER
jgi:hypothetical protein